ncbi:unnamed protein product [Closterium sp. NIES-54]
MSKSQSLDHRDKRAFARASTALLCPAVSSGSLSGLHLPSFSTNLVNNAALQDVWVDTFTPGGQRVAISSCSCRVLSHQTLLWHYRLGHPSLPRLCSMHSRLLVSGLPRSLPSLPHSPALPCLPCIEGRQRAAPHSSEFPPMIAPLQTLHMDVWGTTLLNLWPRVSEPETSPTLRWTGKVGDASVFWVWGTLSLVRDAKASKLSSRTLRSVFLGFPTNAPPWQFYHPRSRRVFSSQDDTFDESVYFYRLHPHTSHPVPLAPLFLVDPPPLDEPVGISYESSGPAEGGDPAADDTAATHRSPRLESPPGFPPRPSLPPQQPTAMDSGAAAGGDTGGEGSGGAETEGEGYGGSETEGAGSGGAAPGG